MDWVNYMNRYTLNNTNQFIYNTISYYQEL
jgi:hypothetical protein